MVIGETLGHFEVTAKLGEGGMGEVYRARDTKLGREVAIKVLPPAFVSDPERLARFEREARVLASLNHPNIASLYEVCQEGGVHFLVMELAAGETLAARMARGPLPVEEAKAIALEIARALEAAHECGVVHRDLKPANVAVSETGEVKVLDFGLAKALEVETAPAAEGLSESPTLTYQATVAGVLLGTAPYMSPEQARGRPVDKRADIWAFGVVLWEMLAGRRLFDGESVSDVLAAVLKEDPPAEALPRNVPRFLSRLLDRCLERDPRQRLRDVGEARIALAAGADDPVEEDRPGGPGGGVVLAAALAAAVLAAGLAWVLRPAATPAAAASEVSFSVRLPDDLQLDQSTVTPGSFAVAPDGSFLAFSARRRDGQPQIFRRDVDSLEIVPVEGGEGGREPFISPDSRWIGFFTREHGLAKVAAEGGIPQRIYDGERLMASGAFWGVDDRIYFARGLSGGIAAVAASGGVPELLTRPDLEAGEVGHWNPRLSPSGRELLFGALTVAGWRNRILELATGAIREIDTLGWLVSYVDSGHLLWLEEGDLIAAPFDLRRGRYRGDGRAILSGVSSFEVSAADTLAYTTHLSAQAAGVLMRWTEESGSMEIEGLGGAQQVRVAPDGRRLVVWAALQLWIADLDRGARSPLTTEGLLSNFPTWSPDGTRVAFNSIRSPHGLYVRSIDGAGEARLVLARTTDVVYLPASWSPDGRGVAVTEFHADGQADVAIVDLDSGSRTALVATNAIEHSPAISPDGLWLAYVSNVSGRDEIYLQPYLREGRRVSVSTSGGSDPRWSGDGRTLYFRQQSSILTVAVSSSDGELDLGVPQVLAELPQIFGSAIPYAPLWDVAPDGSLVYLQLPSDQPGGDEIFVVRGWARELETSSR